MTAWKRGYTLLEAALVVVIIGVLAALAVSSYDRMRTATTFSTSTNQLVAELSNARSKARGEEHPIVVVFLASTTNAAESRYMVVQDNNRTFDLATYTPGSLPAGAKLISDVTISGAAFDTSLTKTRTALPDPFASVSTRGGITFAKNGFTAPYDLRGSLTFETDGRVSFSDASGTGSIHLVESANPHREFTVGLIGATGILKGF